MRRSEVHDIVVEELVAVQKAIGVEVRAITNATRPVGDLDKFDSPVAEDTAAAILAKLKAPPDTKCPFTMRDDGKYLTIDKVVDHFCKAIGI